jgi:hypothetical protein
MGQARGGPVSGSYGTKENMDAPSSSRDGARIRSCTQGSRRAMPLLG